MVSSYLSNVVPKVYGKNALVLFFQRQGQEVAEALIEKLEREWNYDRAGGKPLTLFNMLHRAIHNNEADTSFKKKEEDKPAATSAGEGMIDYLVHKFQKLEHGFKSDEGNGEKGQKPKAIPIIDKMTIDLGGNNPLNNGGKNKKENEKVIHRPSKSAKELEWADGVEFDKVRGLLLESSAMVKASNKAIFKLNVERKLLGFHELEDVHLIDYLVHEFQKLEHGFKSDEGNGEKGQKPKAIPINGKMTIDLGGKKQSVETCYPKYDALMQKMISHVNNFLNEDVDSGFDTRTINVQIMKVRLRLSAIYTQPLKLIYPNSTLASLHCPTASDGDFGVEEALGSRGRQQGAEGQGGARKGVREQAE
jgi:hypothetical protein